MILGLSQWIVRDLLAGGQMSVSSYRLVSSQLVVGFCLMSGQLSVCYLLVIDRLESSSAQLVKGQWLLRGLLVGVLSQWSDRGWLVVSQLLVSGRLVVGQWSVSGQIVVGQWSVSGWLVVGQWSVSGTSLRTHLCILELGLGSIRFDFFLITPQYTTPLLTPIK